RIEGTPADGDVVDLVSDKGRFIARGMINAHSRLRVRLYSWDPGGLLDEAFFRRRLEAAIQLRRDLGFGDPSRAARLLLSEGDGLSGLVVDRYADYLSVQTTALAMHRRIDEIVHVLTDLVHPRGIVLRHEKGAAQLEGMPHESDRHWGQLPEGP